MDKLRVSKVSVFRLMIHRRTRFVFKSDFLCWAGEVKEVAAAACPAKSQLRLKELASGTASFFFFFAL